MNFRPHRTIRQVALVLLVLTNAATREDRAVVRAQEARAALSSAGSNFLTGTYRETDNQDFEIGRKALAATAHLDTEERERQGRALLRTLRSAPVFAIEQYGTTVMVNYPGGIRVPYEADGRPRRMRATGAESISIQAAFVAARRLTIDLMWSGGERLRLIFDISPDGETLTYTRIAGNRFLESPITVTSRYVRTSAKATRIFERLAATP
ncbi:MAG TPA: hypothetical protein VGW12_17225 [Pyrinomonadaceae bacterium]|nr:hypothetical protein [Pyrinomonadaceae bacterium]